MIWVDGKRIYEHRLKVEAGPEEVVHHENGNKHDNGLGNLEKMTKAKHTSLHHQQTVIARYEKRWPGLLGLCVGVLLLRGKEAMISGGE
jgi:hypothetical protein